MDKKELKTWQVRIHAREDLRLLHINSKALIAMTEYAIDKQELDIVTHNAIDGLIEHANQLRDSLNEVTAALDLSQ